MKKALRIRKNEEFSSIIKQKHSIASAGFIIYYTNKKLEHIRVGISVSKSLGNAVERNKIKRQVRNLIRNNLDFENLKYDLIVIVRKPFINRSYLDNENDLKVLVKKL